MKKYSFLFISLLVGAFLMQGFQCASPEFTTAKLALKNKDYPKAEEYFEKEVAKNPTNGEAWGFLAEVRLFLKKYELSNEAVDNALKYTKNDKNTVAQLMQLKRTLWIESYKGVIENLNKYYQTQKPELLDEALQSANMGMKIKPDLSEFAYLRGKVYSEKKDNAKSLADYELYYEMIAPSLEIAKQNSVFKGADRAEVLKKVGKPQLSPAEILESGDSSVTDIIILQNQDKSNKVPAELYLRSVGINGKYIVDSWSYTENPSPTLADKLVFFNFNLEALIELVQFNFDNKNYEKALKYLNGILIIDPMNEAANSFMITVYENMGKKDEATKRIENLVKNEPENKTFRFTYGNLLMQMGRYDEAIAQYEKAVEIDGNYYDALRNLASSYKNKAVKIQLEQKDAMLKDKTGKTQMNPQEYLPYIKKSGEHFERCRKSPKYANDFYVLADLADIYYVADDKDKLKQIVAELESIETMIPDATKLDYYLKMVRIFQQVLPNEKKSAIYEEKANSLN